MQLIYTARFGTLPFVALQALLPLGAGRALAAAQIGERAGVSHCMVPSGLQCAVDRGIFGTDLVSDGRCYWLANGLVIDKSANGKFLDVFSAREDELDDLPDPPVVHARVRIDKVSSLPLPKTSGAASVFQWADQVGAL